MKTILLNLLLAFFSLIFVGCTIDDKGDFVVTPLGWIILVLFVILFICIGFSTEKERKITKQKMEEEGESFDNFKVAGMYVSGHPQLNDSIKNVAIKKENNILNLYTYNCFGVDYPVRIDNSSIEISSITDIKIEDATTIEQKITVGRMLLVGVFALAWRKRKKNEMAFLTIYWKFGRFEQETIFMFDGKEAIQKANACRNQLMALCE